MDLGKVFAALADDSRRKVIASLAADSEDQEHACGSFDLPVKKATRTHHFRVLREAGLVVQRDHGNGSTLRLRRTDIEEHCPGLLRILVTERDDQAGLGDPGGPGAPGEGRTEP
ncbi:ArsR/SmtB family transcription factor [Streptomyces sp. NPDC057621]|uniref:ArsR/SmtB family transcription factor n=1 Tax=unclassified Streptomyces TaxID=2593676 RepID=UPI0036A30DD9